MPFEIEKDVPIPRSKRDFKQYPFPEMEINDSFVCPTKDGTDISSVQTNILSAARHWCVRNHKNRKFKTRRVDGGVRIWRVE